uniref:Coiled-coil-helix-coiled-coil-helix domain containing 2 n=1 Tax=Oreochromis aureus TaxID=47969 RepID=A0AAZ1XV61_OREAU
FVVASRRASEYYSPGLHRPHHLRPGLHHPHHLRPRFPPYAPAPSAVGTPSGQCMFAQMASTATGVAVGSGAGATVTQTMTGGLGGGQSEPARPDITQVSPGLASHRTGTACSEEMRSFLACAINTSDLKVCEGVNEALKKCIFANGK